MCVLLVTSTAKSYSWITIVEMGSKSQLTYKMLTTLIFQSHQEIHTHILKWQIQHWSTAISKFTYKSSLAQLKQYTSKCFPKSKACGMKMFVTAETGYLFKQNKKTNVTLVCTLHTVTSFVQCSAPGELCSILNTTLLERHWLQGHESRGLYAQ